MEKYLEPEAFDLPVKNLSVEAHKRWRDSVSFVRNRRRRFRYAPNLEKREEAKELMEKTTADAINRRAIEVAEWLHSIIDIPDSPFGKPPHGESTHNIHFGIPDAFAKSISKEDYYKYYEPRVVSIGPFHHGKAHVAPTENIKRQAVRNLAEEVKSEVSIEQTYASVEQDLLRLAKECYNVSRWQGISDPEWCLMMFLDGCFVIDFFSNYDIATSGGKSWLSIMKKRDIDLVLRDLLLLENQLPFEVLLVLERAFRREGFVSNFIPIEFLRTPLSMIFSTRLASILTGFDIRYLNHLLRERNAPAGAPVHLLQYFRDIWVSLLFKDDVKEEEYYHHVVCPPFSVTELKKVGICCSCTMPNYNFLSPRGIHFKSSILSGHLLLPPLTIDEWTVTLFSNIIAYEDSCSMLRKSSAISSYLNFMCMLINGEEDVKELRARGILNVNFKIDDDKLINFLRDITAYHEPNPQHFRDVKQQISTWVRSKRLPLRIAYDEFKQRYFSGPWSFLVFLAVIFTVSMTVIQTGLAGIQTVFTGIQTYK